MPNSFLYVKAVVKPGWTNKEGVKGDPRVGFTDFTLLHDIMEKMCKKITIKLALKEVQEEMIKDLQHLFATNGGSHSLRFIVYDAEEKLEIDVPSRTTKVKITNEFLAKLDKQHISYKLN